MLVHNYLKNSAKKYPYKYAVICQERSIKYSELDKLSDIFAKDLINQGIVKGNRVALVLDNCCEYIISYFGILKSGAVVVSLNTQMIARELVVPLADCKPKIVVTDLKHSQTIKDALKLYKRSAQLLIISKDGLETGGQMLEPRKSFSDVNSHKDLAMIIYTSGTTGKPKGVMLSHSNLSVNADSIIEYLHLRPADKMMVVLPLYYSYGTSLLTTHIKTGSTLVIDNRFMYPNVVLDTMQREKVTGFAGVPSHYAILLKKSAIRQYRFPNLRYVTQAGGAMAPALIEEFLSIFPETKFYVMYGQTEAAARLSYLDPDHLAKKMGSIGKAIPGVELKVLNESGDSVRPGEIGEIVARGKNVMKGYWGADEETSTVLKKEGLFTGDLARVDEEGYIYLVSRKKDIIKSGANRISPIEIESVVCQIPEVLECAAIGVADEILGEAIKLFVVLKDDLITKADIKNYCKNNLASYKCPKGIEIVAELPKTVTGKIKRGELKAAAKQKELTYENMH